MPQLEQIDTFASQVFWLFVSFALLYYLMAKVVLPRIAAIMAEREDRVAQDLARAQTLKLQAEQIMEEYERSLAKARAEAGLALKQVSDQVSADIASRQQAADDELAKKADEAEARIAEAKKEALANVKSVAEEVTKAAVDKLLGVQPQGEAVERAVDRAMGSN